MERTPTRNDIYVGARLKRCYDNVWAAVGDICEIVWVQYARFGVLNTRTGRTFNSAFDCLGRFKLLTPLEEVAAWAAQVDAAKEKIHGTHTDG